MRKPKLPHIGRRRLSVAHLVVALVVMFMVLPFADHFKNGTWIEAIAFSVVLLAAVNAIGGVRRTQIGAVVLVAPALLMRWLNHIWPGFVPVEPALIAAFIFVAFVIAHLLRFVMSAPAVNSEVLCAAISVYLLFAVAWSFLYTFVAALDPDAFAFNVPANTGKVMHGFTSLYFSVESLSTIAFGDIIPVSNVARMLVLVEAVTGMFYMTLLIARLVSLYAKGKTE